MGARHNTIIISGILVTTILMTSLFAFSPQQAYAPQPPAQFFLCGKIGWDHSPTVRIDTTNEPGLKDFENGVKISDTKTDANILIRDAITDYWEDGSGAGVHEGEEGDAGSDFSGFGAVTSGTGGTADITIKFVNSFTFRASCQVGEPNDHITSATIFLANTNFESTMNTSSFGGDDTFKNTVAHELGHAIGLKHNGEPGTMMNTSFFGGLPRFIGDNPYHTAYMPLGDATQKQITRIYG